MDEPRTLQPSAAEPDGAVIRLLVRPLPSHYRLLELIDAVAALPGVMGVEPGRFRGDAVVLDVTCSGAAPLARALTALRGFRPEVAVAHDGSLLVRLADPAAAAATAIRAFTAGDRTGVSVSTPEEEHQP